VRLVAIDIDGTLLPTFSQVISPRNATALKAAQDSGIVVAIATGQADSLHGATAGWPGPASGYAADYVEWGSDADLGGDRVDRSQLDARVARGLCGLLRKSERWFLHSTNLDAENWW